MLVTWHRKPTNIMTKVEETLSIQAKKDLRIFVTTAASQKLVIVHGCVSPVVFCQKRIHEEIRILGKPSPQGQQNYTNIARCAVLTGKNGALFQNPSRLIHWSRRLVVTRSLGNSTISDWITILCDFRILIIFSFLLRTKVCRYHYSVPYFMFPSYHRVFLSICCSWRWKFL